MVAKLISPQGEEFELSDDLYLKMRELLPSETVRPKTQAERLRETLKRIAQNPDKKSDEWWDEFEQFLKENRFNLNLRNLD